MAQQGHVSGQKHCFYETGFSTHTRQRCVAVVGLPQRSFFLSFEHEFDGTVHFVLCYEASCGENFCWGTCQTDGEELEVWEQCVESGETFLTEEQK